MPLAQKKVEETARKDIEREQARELMLAYGKNPLQKE